MDEYFCCCMLHTSMLEGENYISQQTIDYSMYQINIMKDMIKSIDCLEIEFAIFHNILIIGNYPIFK